MIYNFTVNIAEQGRKPILKQFYLTADNDSAFYRRCLEQYRVQRLNIEILERISDKEIDPNVLPEKRIGKKSESKSESPQMAASSSKPKAAAEGSQQILQIQEMLAKVRGVSGEDLKKKEEEGWLLKETSDPVSELKVALSIYKKVKFYYKRTGAKKNKVYVILCKDQVTESLGKRSQKTASRSSKGGKKKTKKKSIRKKSE